VHLVIDAVVTPWLEEQLQYAERAAADGDSLEGWMPHAVRTNAAPPVVDWCDIGRAPFTEPFFSQTVQPALRSPARLRTTSVETLIARRTARPGVHPTAFIFHTSRCGSTLLSQMAAALPHTIVISEAPPIDDVLRAREPESTRVEWLRALVAALGQRRGADARHFFIKFDAWHILELEAVQRAFPDVPCVFLYRDPAAVVASQLRMPGLHMVPGMLDPSPIGLDLPALLELGREQYVGRMLAAVYAAGLSCARDGRVTLMNYSELPEGGAVRLFDWCGLKADSRTRERLDHVAQFDAKTPSLPFETRGTVVDAARDESAIRTARAFITTYYEQLETLRLF